MTEENIVCAFEARWADTCTQTYLALFYESKRITLNIITLAISHC